MLGHGTVDLVFVEVGVYRSVGKLIIVEAGSLRVLRCIVQIAAFVVVHERGEFLFVVESAQVEVFGEVHLLGPAWRLVLGQCAHR